MFFYVFNLNHETFDEKREINRIQRVSEQNRSGKTKILEIRQCRIILDLQSSVLRKKCTVDTVISIGNL